MKLLLVFLLGPALLASPPLHVVGVVRSGMPPYEEARLYRLEGTGCLALRVGERLTLQRAGEARPLGRLQVTAVKSDHALAKLAESGETYPLKEDLAVRHEEAVSLPTFPTPPMPTGTVDVAPKPPVSAQLPSPSKSGRRESIFFLKGSAELSAGARAKLAAWVKAWGSGGHWSVGCPEGADLPPALQQARLEQLRNELLRLGVLQVTILPQPYEASDRYDPVFVCHEAL